MNKTNLILTALLVTPGIMSADPVRELKSDIEMLSYSIGMQIGANLQQQGFDIDPVRIAQGMRAGFHGTELLISAEDSSKAMARLRAQLSDKRKEKGEANLKAGQAFLEANREQDGVVELDSGLQYKAIAEGEGASPQKQDRVTVHYRGRLLDGTEFDSSYKRGKPSEFGLTGVIKGWQEALPLMKTGAKWELYIPSKLAYGSRGKQPDIGPNSVLIFDIELVAIKPNAKGTK